MPETVWLPIIWFLGNNNELIVAHPLSGAGCFSAARLTHTCLFILGYGNDGGEAAPYPCKVKVGTFV